MKYIETRFEMKEKIDHWAFKWSHLILEEVFVRPEYDIRELLWLIDQSELGELMPKSKIQSLISDGQRLNLSKDAPKLNEALTSKKLGEKCYKGDQAFLMRWLVEVNSFFQKIKGMVDFIVHACNGVDALLETEKWVNLKGEMNRKILTLKK